MPDSQQYVLKFLSLRYATIGGLEKICLVAGSSVITLKLSSKVRLILLFRGGYVKIKGILLKNCFLSLVFNQPRYHGNSKHLSQNARIKFSVANMS